MSTSAVTTWVTDISQLGPIYPFVGWEIPLYLAGLVFWIMFHILQTRIESKELKEANDSLAVEGELEKAMKLRDHQDRY